MCGSKGSNQVSTQSGPPAQFLAAYDEVLGRARGVADQPLQQYDIGSNASNVVAPLQANQRTAISTVGGLQGGYAPYLGEAMSRFDTATQPLNVTQFPGLAMLPHEGLAGMRYGEQLGSRAADVGLDTAGRPITLPGYDTLSTYESPYTKQVTDALQGDFDQQRREALNAVRGNAAAHNAFGGDREAIAEAITAREMARAQAPVLAQVRQSGFAQAQNELNTQQQLDLERQSRERQYGLAGGQLALGAGQLALSGGQSRLGTFGQEQQLEANTELALRNLNQGAGYGIANLGMLQQNLGLAGADALLRAGGLEQGQAQQVLNAPYQQFNQQQAYPFQTTGWLANIAEGLGGASGGTGTTTYPGPSMLGQIGGLASAGTGILGMTGAFGNNGWMTGSGSSGGGFGGGGGGDLTSWLPNSGTGGFESGGRVDPPHYALGGPTPYGVPDLSMSIIPGANGLGVDPPPGAGGGLRQAFFQPVTTQTQTSSGGGGLGGILGAAANIAKIGGMFFEDGGSVSRGLIPPPDLSASYVPPPTAARLGNTIPKPPTMPQRPDPARQAGLDMFQAVQRMSGMGRNDERRVRPELGVAEANGGMVMPGVGLQSYAEGGGERTALAEGGFPYRGAYDTPTLGAVDGDQQRYWTDYAAGLGQQFDAGSLSRQGFNDDVNRNLTAMRRPGDFRMISNPELAAQAQRDRDRMVGSTNAWLAGRRVAPGMADGLRRAAVEATPTPNQNMWDPAGQAAVNLRAASGPAPSLPSTIPGSYLTPEQIWMRPPRQPTRAIASDDESDSSFPSWSSLGIGLGGGLAGAALAALLMGKRGKAAGGAVHDSGRMGLQSYAGGGEPVASADLPPPIPDVPGWLDDVTVARLANDVSQVREADMGGLSLPPPVRERPPVGLDLTTPLPAEPALQPAPAGNSGIMLTPPAEGSGSGMPVEQAAALVRQHESSDNPFVGYGGTDLSNAPRDEYGFPVWSGKEGPQGISHAAGLYQFQPGTWRKYAQQAGVRDFSPESQDKVFRAAYAAEGFGPWAPYNAKIAAAIGPGRIGPRGGGVSMDFARPRGMATEPDSGGRAGLDRFNVPAVEDAEGKTPIRNMLSSPWMPLVAVGAGMLASRSPHPGNALGEGLELGLKAAGQQGERENRAELNQVRMQSTQQQARNMAEKLDTMREGLSQRAERDAANLALKGTQVENQMLAKQAQIAKDLAVLDERRQFHQTTAADQEKRRQLEQERNDLTGRLRDMQAGRGKWEDGSGTDEEGKTVQGKWWLPANPDPDKPHGGSIFYPGMSSQKQSLAVQAFEHKRKLWLELHPEDKAGAADFAANRKSISSGEYARLVEGEMRRLGLAWKDDLSKIGKAPPDFRKQAEQTVQGLIGNAPVMGRSATPPAGAAASGGPPVGTTVGGYRFKGGNPNDKSNWEPVQ